MQKISTDIEKIAQDFELYGKTVRCTVVLVQENSNYSEEVSFEAQYIHTIATILYGLKETCTVVSISLHIHMAE